MRPHSSLSGCALVAALLASLASVVPGHAQEVLTNESVVQLTQAGVDPAVIVSAIESSSSRFELGVQKIVDLSGKKVHKDVISAMQASLARGGQAVAGKAATAPQPGGPLPTTYGAYAGQGDRFDVLPVLSLTAKEIKDRDGKVINRVLDIGEPASARRAPVHAAEPSFVLYQQKGADANGIKLYPVHWSTTPFLSAHIATDAVELPVRVGPLGADSRYVQVTPARDLPVGVYALVHAESRGTVYLIYRVRGELSPRGLEADPAAALAAAGGGSEMMLEMPVEEARALVQQVLSREKIAVERDFDANGLLISRTEFRMGGFLGRNTNREQYAVLVEPATAGSRVRVLADVWKAGTPDGAVNESNARVTHLIRDAEGNAKRAESMTGEIRKAAQRAARRR
jgi:hypothetical protein